MHVHFLDPFRIGKSVIHQLDPRVKLVFVFVFILTTSLLPFGAWPAYVLMLAVVLSVELLSELGIRYVLARAFLATPFVLAALPLIFTVEGAPLARFSIGAWTLTMTVEGVERLASIAFKSWVSVQMAIVLTATTSFPDLLLAMRGIGIPRLLVAILGLMWRYIFVLADEALRLLRARAARSGAPPEIAGRVGGSLAWRARTTGGMAGNLMMRSFERGDRIYAAMAARGYDGEVRAFPLPPVPPVQWLGLGGATLVLMLILAFSILVAR
jgi:cobalt/nickel transport system permease protein